MSVSYRDGVRLARGRKPRFFRLSRSSTGSNLKVSPSSLRISAYELPTFASEPVTETSAPYCDFAVPFA